MNNRSKYDILFKNARIFTCDDANLYAHSFAIKDGNIAWLGTNREAKLIEGSSEKSIDLKGKRVIPGIVDAHMHAIMMAEYLRMIAVLPPEILSIEALITAIKRECGKVPKGKIMWIQGWGYDEGKLKEKRAPQRYDLDKGSEDLPVVITRTCIHIIAVNSKAIEIAGITKETPDPEGGKIGRDETGEPNGLFYENARFLITRHIPQPTEEEIADNLAHLDKILVSQGITSISELGEFGEYDFDSIFDYAIKKGMKSRITAYYLWEQIKHLHRFQIAQQDMDPQRQYRIAGVKLIGDGSISGKTAWEYKSFLDGEYGMPTCTEKELEEAIAFCKDNKCQLAVHAMGARMIDRVIEHMSLAGPWTAGAGPHVRIEHVAEPTKEAIQGAAQMGIGFVTQPIFLYCEIESYLENLGKERTKECYPICDWIEAGVRFCFSTDAPATSWANPFAPFVNLKAAVMRKAWNGMDTGQRHKIEIETAIKLYTKEAAEMLGLVDVGMIKEGYAADFIVLDRDMIKIPPEEIDQMKVLATFIKGEKVYDAES